MIIHNLKSAFHAALRDKQYFTINILGLAIALCAVVLITLFVRDELGYDKWITDSDRIYKIESTINGAGSAPILTAVTPGTLAPILAGNFEGDIEQALRVYRMETTVRIEDKQFNETVDYVDANYFDIFNIPFVSGIRDSALRGSNNVVISRAMATKYFGDSDPMAKIFNIDHSPSNSKIDYQVAGIFENVHGNSHIDASFIALLVPDRYVDWPWVTQDWNSLTNHTYVKFAAGTDINSFKDRFSEFAKTLPIRASDDNSAQPRFIFNLMNVTDIHLKSEALAPLKPGGDMTSINTFSIIALLIILMASINFTNLSSAQAIKRSREVSIRKVLGASRKQLIIQFLTEAILTSFLAMLVALAAVEMLLPVYNDFLGKNISLYSGTIVLDILMLIAFTVIVGVFAGAYPAFVSSSFRPAKVLRSSHAGSQGSARLRHVLLVVQFTISIGLIVSMMIIYSQTIYSQNIDAGIDKENRLTLTGASFNQAAPASLLLKEELSKIPGVKSVGLAADTFPNRYNINADFNLTSGGTQRAISVKTMYMGPDFLKTYNVEPLAGRLFSKDILSDFSDRVDNGVAARTRGAIINESMLRLTEFGSAEAAIGQHILMGNETITDVEIVGVVRDLHVSSTRQSTPPMIFFTTINGMDYITLDLVDATDLTVRQQISNIWIQHLPEVPMIASLSTDAFDTLYLAEIKRAKIFAIFSILSVVISSIGLYGLAAFVAESRTKEIGIRKVLGATILDIVKLLLFQFSKPILLANLIAWPIAYFNMENWLSAFAYRIDISLAYFIFSGALTLIIAWGVVITHAIRVARANPIDALRVS